MAGALEQVLPWIDARKRQAIAELSTAAAAPETIGPNIWAALQDFATNLGLKKTPQQEQRDKDLESVMFRGSPEGEAAQRAKIAEAAMGFGEGGLAGTVGKIGLRRGPLSPTGSHFATRGESTYFDPGSEGIGTYNLGGVKILDTGNPQEALPVLRSVAQHPDTMLLKGNDPQGARSALARAMLDARAGEAPIIDYITAENTPLSTVAKQHGYDGYKVWENDDWSAPSTAFVWNLAKVRPHGEVASAEMQALQKLLHKP